jgi:hypothetical protein
MKIYIAMLSFLISAPLFAQKEWSLKKDKDDIQIYTRSVNKSKIKAYKAEMTVKSSLDKVKDVILDGNQLYVWNYKAIDSKLLEKSPENTYLIWVALNLPWPLRNRDFVASLKLNRISQDAIRIDIIAASDQHEIQEDYLRMISFEGFWLLEQQGDMVKITHQMYGDPGGNLPNWFINSTIARAPYYNFVALRERVQ